MNVVRFLNLEITTDMKHSLLRMIAICCIALAPLAGAQTPSAEAVELLRKMAAQPATAIPPIKIPTSARTELDVERELGVWTERVILKPALERIAARKDAPWAKDAEHFLKEAGGMVF